MTHNQRINASWQLIADSNRCIKNSRDMLRTQQRDNVLPFPERVSGAQLIERLGLMINGDSLTPQLRLRLEEVMRTSEQGCKKAKG